MNLSLLRSTGMFGDVGLCKCCSDGSFMKGLTSVETVFSVSPMVVDKRSRRIDGLAERELGCKLVLSRSKT